ncbi:MAG: CDP-alcohol phosphatidyltransferase [Bacteroidetes bacterium]|nr:CDP-alcohol phosphatidyltransferase [Bacteroidota bacterium]
MSGGRKLNVPNILSGYRLLSFPFLLWMIIDGREDLFVVFFVINLITDILDGMIARSFNLQTEFGSRLDSLADDGTYILAITGVLKFHYDDFEPHFFSFFVFVSLFILTIIISLIRFKKTPSLHLYSWKIGGYMQGIFLFTVFVFGFNVLFYYGVIIWGILSFVEHIVVQFQLNEMSSNAKGLYWILKDKRRM